MGDVRKQKLMALGENILAEALLDLADKSEVALDAVERLLVISEENVQRLKAQILKLTHIDHYYEWNEAPILADQLSGLLDAIDAGVDDPCTGAELVLSFFETDAAVFERCDDSYGNVGDVYMFNARDLFLSYAERCDEKTDLATRIFEFSQNDNHGVRIALIDCADEYLPTAIMKRLISRFRDRLRAETSESARRYWQPYIESLEDQLI